MKTLFLISLVTLFLISCSAKPKLLYYSAERYPPKSSDYTPVILQTGQETDKPYKIIGRIKIEQDPVISDQKVIENLQNGCRQMGGDGLINIHKTAADASNPFMPWYWEAEIFIWQ